MAYQGRPIDHHRRRKDPGAWQSVGVSLYHAAHVLWLQLRPSLVAYEAGQQLTPQQELDLRLMGPFAMLSGMCIECMLKGAITQKRREPPKTHDLRDLSRRAGIQWQNANEVRELLGRLTAFVRWAGRYPVATTEKESRAPRILALTDYARIAAIAEQLTDLHLGRGVANPPTDGEAGEPSTSTF